ncbi:MAG: tetratricopeptide repeat protein [Planctomycetota bacterium]
MKELGFTDAQIREDVEEQGLAGPLSKEDREKLDAAGFGAALRTYLLDKGTEPLTVDKVVKLVEAGTPVTAVIETLRQAHEPLVLTPAQALDLKKRGLPLWALLALRAQPLSHDNLETLANSKKLSAADWTALADHVGVAKSPLPPAKALALVKAGVPKQIVTRARGEAAPTPAEDEPAPTPPADTPTADAPPEDEGNSLFPTMPKPGARPAAHVPTQEVPPSTPVVDTGGSSVPTMPTASATQEDDSGIWQITKPSAPGVYRHVGKRFEVNFPKEWRIFRLLDDGSFNYYFTPEAAKTDPHECKVVVQMALWGTPEAIQMQGSDPASILRRLLPQFKQGEPGLKPVSEVQAERIGGRDGAKVTLHGALKETAGDFRIDAHVVERDGLTFLVLTQAPRADYARWQPQFATVLAKSRFGRAELPRPDRSIEAREIVKKYKGSTVSVESWKGGKPHSTGTGFIISKQGYLLTNHHVVFDRETGKPHTQFVIAWDEGMKRPKKPAKLINLFYDTAYRDVHSHGTDIAMLKIEPGDYEPWPLTPLSAVEPGDRVVSLGFPSRGMMSGISITITTGVVTRFNRGPKGKVQTIYTDAAITHGSSGGPCVSLVTGGVIGLNTFGMPLQLDQRRQHLNDLVNYFGVVPIGACFREFPLVTDLGIDHAGAKLDFFDTISLSQRAAEAGSPRAARRLAERAVELRRDEADAHWQLAYCQYLEAIERSTDEGPAAALKMLPDIVATFQQGLNVEPNHLRTLSMLAQSHLELGKVKEAAAYAERAVKADPDNWEGYMMRGRCALVQKNYDAAVTAAGEAKKKSGNLIVAPYGLAGDAYYAKGAHKAGRREYDQAVKLEPYDLYSRLGRAQYHELEKNPDDAVAEYQEILKDFPGNPVILYRAALAYYYTQRFKDALPFFNQALDRYNTLNEKTPEDLFIAFGLSFMRTNNRDGAIQVFTLQLSQYPMGQYADTAHIQLATVNKEAKRMGLSAGHLHAAGKVSDEEKTRKQIKGMRLPGLAVVDIQQMLQLRYPLATAYGVIISSPLAFAVQSEADVKRLQQEHRIPGPLIRAILMAQKENGVAQGGGAGAGADAGAGAGAGAGRQPQQPRAASIVGLWRALIDEGGGMRTSVVLQFDARGRWAMSIRDSMGNQTEDQGTYKVTKTEILSRSADGTTERSRYRLQGDVLDVELQDGTRVRFQRRRK